MHRRSHQLATALVPRAPGLRLDDLQMTETRIIVFVTSTTPIAPCPRCQCPATRVRSRYQRTLADLPWSGLAVTLRLSVRKFACDTPTCPQQIFTERLPSVTVTYARRTNQLAEVLRAIAFAAGGEAGRRLLDRLRMPGSAATLLRLIRQTPLPEAETPRVLGIDDWARRKGQTYGTILVDLERRRPVDLLPDRTVASVSAWLRAHPGVEIISRDRGAAYAEGATIGAPAAIQVADRWHLLHNLADALERAFQPHRTCIMRAVGANASSHIPDDAGTSAAARPPSARTRREQVVRTQRRAARLERFLGVKQLHGLGVTQRDIAKQVGISHKTVQRWVHVDSFPDQPPRPARGSRLDPYKPYVLERWAAGCHNGARLLQEIAAQGYRGGRTTLRDFLALLRPPRGAAGQSDGSTPVTVHVQPQPPTLRQLVWYVLRRDDTVTEEEVETVARLRSAHADVEQAVEFAQAFATMVRERQGDQLEGWLWRVANSNLPALRSFATGIQRDKPAVVAGLTLKWSQGQVEGQITRLKLIKRSTYGRASFDLLRQRVLHAG